MMKYESNEDGKWFVRTVLMVQLDYKVRCWVAKKNNPRMRVAKSFDEIIDDIHRRTGMTKVGITNDLAVTMKSKKRRKAHGGIGDLI